MKRPAALLFDLDGTLVDSAPDLAGAANDMLLARGRDPLPLHALRPHGGSGARGMIGAAFGLVPGDAGYDALRDEFLCVYEGRLLRHTVLFDEVPALVGGLAAAGLPFGIVTNKAMRLATPLAEGVPVWANAGTGAIAHANASKLAHAVNAAAELDFRAMRSSF